MWRFATHGLARPRGHDAGEPRTLSLRPRLHATEDMRAISSGRPAQPPRQAGAGAAVRRGLAAVLALVTVLTAGAATDARALESAVLDTLETRPELPPWEAAAANFDISRRMLPDIEATSLPQAIPPDSPPRLDDPLAGASRFVEARAAARDGEIAVAQRLVNEAVNSGASPARYRWWQTEQALRNADLGAFIWTLPKAVVATWREPMAGPRLLVLAHQGGLVAVGLFWSLLVVTYLAVYWRFLAHDLANLLLRHHRRGYRAWTPWLVVLAVVLVRPGWLGGLALLSVPLVIQTRGHARGLLIGVWVAALLLVAPWWPHLREATVTLDPASETVLLSRAGNEPANPTLMADLRQRLASAEDPDRRLRLEVALGIQEARRGRFTASNRHFEAALTQRPQHVTARVGLANNAYFQSRFDDALAGYQAARQLAPKSGAIPYNLAQVYFKKLFVPEAGQALEDARDLGFDPAPWRTHEGRGTSFSPVVYLGLDRRDLRDSARSEAAAYPPLAHLAAWNTFLGMPPLPPLALLGGLLVVALALGYWWTSHDRTRTCENCGAVICRDCCLEREDTWYCSACGDTATRARSEMVLATLLKNRSRAAGLARTAQLSRLARVLPGAGHLALGQVGHTAWRLLGLSVALFLLLFAWSLAPAAAWQTPGLVLAEETVHALWWPLPVAMWPGLAAWPVGLGVVLLLLVYLGALADGAQLRHRLPERLIQGLDTPVPRSSRA